MIGNYNRWPIEADEHLEGGAPSNQFARYVLINFGLSLFVAASGAFLVAVLAS